MRANSKEANSSKSLAIMDVNQNAVVSAMENISAMADPRAYPRPAVYELIANQQPAFRVVLRLAYRRFDGESHGG